MPTEISKAASLATSQFGNTRRGSWLLAILGISLLCWLAWQAQRGVRSSVEQSARATLVGMLTSKIIALEIWLDQLQRIASHSLESQEIRQVLLSTIQSQANSQSADLPGTVTNVNLQQALAPATAALGAHDFFVTDRTGRFVSCSIPESVGERLPAEYNRYLTELKKHHAVVVPPQSLGTALGVDDRTEGRGSKTKLGSEFVVIVPLFRENQEVVGTVGFLIPGSSEFSRLLNSGAEQSQVEVYSISRQAQLLSVTGHEELLSAIGFAVKGPGDGFSILVRDPGISLEASGATAWTPAALPMTMAAAGIATASELADDSISTQLNPYRNYRGVPVVGAWSWRPKYQLGIIAEIPHATAYALAHRLEWMGWALIGVSSLSLAATLFSARVARAVSRKLGKAERKLTRLGQYELLEKIGQGGMGEVYRAQHALLRRETAVKICKLDSGSTTANYRFQREVQAASQLNNPHTVRIFDYGQSESGTFFYAMELLHGLNLTGLIRQFGTLTDGRTVYILRQVCESLAEAHGLGLVHRDIKPSNVMIGRRGGVADFVKVLDFGLVRSFGSNRTVSLTLDGCVAGTPHYMSPEASQSPQDVDPRSDLYSVGCLAFHLLSGEPPFKGNNPLEICLKQVREQPPPIQEQSKTSMSDRLADLIMRCLAKSPSDRPQSALEMMESLDRITAVFPWSRSDAELWWRNNAEIAQKVMVAGPDTQATMNTQTPS